MRAPAHRVPLGGTRGPVVAAHDVDVGSTHTERHRLDQYRPVSRGRFGDVIESGRVGLAGRNGDRGACRSSSWAAYRDSHDRFDGDSSCDGIDAGRHDHAGHRHRGYGLKASVLDSGGAMLTDRVRIPTTYPCSPRNGGAACQLVRPLPGFDRVSVGFPGVVLDSVSSCQHRTSSRSTAQAALRTRN